MLTDAALYTMLEILQQSYYVIEDQLGYILVEIWGGGEVNLLCPGKKLFCSVF